MSSRRSRRHSAIVSNLWGSLVPVAGRRSKWLLDWTRRRDGANCSAVVAFDGKTGCLSCDLGRGNQARHMVGASGYSKRNAPSCANQFQPIDNDWICCEASGCVVATIMPLVGLGLAMHILCLILPAKVFDRVTRPATLRWASVPFRLALGALADHQSDRVGLRDGASLQFADKDRC